MAALYTCVGLELKTAVMFARKIVARYRQVVILVYQPYIQPRRTRLAVVAVYALAVCLCGRERSEYSVVFLLSGRIEKTENLLYIPFGAHSGKYGQNSGPVKRLLYALPRRKRLFKRRYRRVEQLPAAERFHYGYPYAFRLTASI